MKVRGGIKRLRRPTKCVCGYFSIYFCLFTQKFRAKCTNKHTSLPGSNKQYAIYLCKAVKPVIVLRNANMTVPRQLCNGHKMLKGYRGLVFDCLLKDVNRPRNTTWCPRIWTALGGLIQCSNAKPQSPRKTVLITRHWIEIRKLNRNTQQTIHRLLSIKTSEAHRFQQLILLDPDGTQPWGSAKRRARHSH